MKKRFEEEPEDDGPSSSGSEPDEVPTANAAAVEYPQCGASGNTITSAATGKPGGGAAAIFHYGDLNASIAVSNQIQPRFPIGAITITET